MHVGVCRIVLHLPENVSLKGKRQTVRSIKDRVRHRFNVSIAEVDDNGRWQRATLGVSYVSNEARHVNEVLSQVVAYVEHIRGDFHLLDYNVELFHGL